MAYPTLVNGQITDAVTQSGVQVLSSVPAAVMGMLYQAMGHSAGLSMQNAVTAQQQMNTISMTATTQGINLLMAMPPAAAARAADYLLTGNSIAQQLLSVIISLAGGKEAQQIVRIVGAGRP